MPRRGRRSCWGRQQCLTQQDPAAASAPFDSSANGVDRSHSLAQDEPRDSVVAKRFAFEPARIEVTEGERVRLVVTSGDGVHGVEIKKFKVNKKVPRGGEAVTIDFVASARRRVSDSLLRVLRRRPRRHERYAGRRREERPIGDHSMTRSFRLLLALLAVVAAAAPAAAAPADPPPPAAAAPPAAQDDDPDRDPNDSQPDFYVATLNTNLRLPKGKMAFRLTHRFLRTLGEGDFGDLLRALLRPRRRRADRSRPEVRPVPRRRQSASIAPPIAPSSCRAGTT